MHNSNDLLKNLSKEEKIDLLGRNSARKSLPAFSIVVDPNYDVNWHHHIIAEKLEQALERILDNKSSRIILELPPRHGKSNLATIKFPAWVLGQHPNLPIIISSYSSDLATDFGLATRDLMNDENYQAIFDTRLRADAKAKSRWMTRKQGSYTAVGVGGSITGRGFKIGIIDDPFKNREEADSEVYREKVWKWYLSTFYTRQDGEGAIIVIATRWHLDDLIGRLIEKEEEDRKAGIENYDHWEVIRFPAIAEEDEDYRKVGEALWPQKFDIDKLSIIENTLGPYEWTALYQQNPISSETQEFKKDWFKYYEEQDLKNLNLKHYTLVDLATGEGTDNNIVRTIGKQIDDPRWFLREEAAGKMDPLQVIDAIFFQYEKYRSEVWIETNSYQKTLKFWIVEEQRKRQIYFNVNELKRNKVQGKEQRIRGLIPLYKAGVIYHQHSDAGLEKEALQFPKGKLDDRIDALASGLEAIENTQEKMKKFKQKPFTPQSEYQGK